MYTYMILQDKARASALLKQKPTIKTDNLNPNDNFMTPPTTPRSLHSRHNTTDMDKPQPLHQHHQLRRSPKISQLQQKSKYQLLKNEIELLTNSWFGKLQPSDPFDVVGDHYDNISEASCATEFWTRCLEEIKMTNIQIENSNSFIHFYSTQFADSLKIVLNNTDDLEKLREYLSATGKRHSRLFNTSEAYYELLRISFLATLMDSFADGFTGELQTAWKNLMTIMIELMNSTSNHLLREIEEETASLLANDTSSFISSSTDSVFDASNDSSLFTRQDSTRTSRSSVMLMMTTPTTPVSTSSKTLRPPITSFYTRPASLKKKNSVSSLKSNTASSSVNLKNSSAHSIAESHSSGSSITTTSTGKKLYNGKPIPAFVQLDLQRIATGASSDKKSISSKESLKSSTTTKTTDSTKGKKKSGRFFNSLLFPTGSMGPLIP